LETQIETLVHGKIGPDVLQRVAEDPYQVQAELCRRSLFTFMKTFWDEVSPDDPVWNWHIPYLCTEIEKVIRRAAAGLPKEYDLIINIPPGTTKTTTCSIMAPDWAWTNWPWMRFITGSYAQKLALESADYSRELIRSDTFRNLYPEYDIKQDKEALGNYRIVVYDKDGRPQTGGNRFSASVGSALTGFHAHVIIVDDPLDPQKAVSETELQTANNWMTRTLSTRKTNKAVTPIILIMQRLAEDDCTGVWLKEEGARIKHICLPGEIKDYKRFVKPAELMLKYKDDLLDPVMLPWPVLNEYKAKGQYFYAGQIGQNPTPPEGGMFKVDHFSIITANQLPPEHSIGRTIRYWDNAATEGGTGAQTAGVKMSKIIAGMYRGKFLIQDCKSGRWGTDEREAIKKETAEADGKNVEVHLEQEPGSGGKDQAMATVKMLAGFHVEVHKVSGEGDKARRADPYSVQVNFGNVLLLQGEWNDGFIKEYRDFIPKGPGLKDRVDAGSGAFNALARVKEVRSLRPSRLKRRNRR
jgi:predicted phage terminase large subunit-like protein